MLCYDEENAFRGSMKKIVLKLPLYYLLFLLVVLTENTLGLYGLTGSLAFALLFCREKLYLFLPGFLGAAATVRQTVPTFVYAAAVIVVCVLSFFLHRAKQWRFTRLETVAYTVFSLAAHVAFGPFDSIGIAYAVISSIGAIILHVLSIVALFPILIRGIRYAMNKNEIVCLGVLVVVLSIGIANYRPFSVCVICILYAALLAPIGAYDRSFALPFGLCVGAGAAIGLFDPSVTLYFAAPALAALALSSYKAPFRALGSVTIFFAATSFFFGAVDLYSFLPFLFGSLLTAFIPDRVIKRFSPKSNDEKFALRTVVHRDRETLSEKLLGVSGAFSEMKEILASERPANRNPDAVVRAVCEKCCIVCPYFRKCAESMGDLAVPVRNLVHSALSGSAVNLLDVDATLGKNCQKIPYLLRTVNEESDSFLQELRRLNEWEQGKETVIAELGGISDVLIKLSDSVNVNLSFDVSSEKRLSERLLKSNVVASDVCIYTDGAEKEVALIVREKDADRESLPAIVSDTVGIPMEEFSRKKEINGEISLHFCRAPGYKILYGESFSAHENRCGDTRQAVKIDNKKSMFLLSDGMGTGTRAHETAALVSRLVETFYKAGFSHETVFANVSGLLALRSQEDFSALDAVVIDLRTAEADFIKQGGRETYLFSGEGYEVIEGDTLPVGIVETTPKTLRKKLRPDDLVILMSDGVADALTPSEVAQVVKSVSTKNPKSAADALIENAKRMAKTPDDMTVVALRIVRA